MVSSTTIKTPTMSGTARTLLTSLLSVAYRSECSGPESNLQGVAPEGCSLQRDASHATIGRPSSVPYRKHFAAVTHFTAPNRIGSKYFGTITSVRGEAALTSSRNDCKASSAGC